MRLGIWGLWGSGGNDCGDGGSLRVLISGAGRRLASIDDAPNRFDPLDIIRNAGDGADGVDDVAARDFGAACVFDDSIESGAILGQATRMEAGGVDVAVNGRVVCDSVIASDCLRAEPIEIGLLDGIAIRVAADPASAAVALAGRAGWFEIRIQAQVLHAALQSGKFVQVFVDSHAAR